MPKPKDPNEDRERREREERERREGEERARHEHGRSEHEPHTVEYQRPEDEDKERPRRRRMGREHAVHQQIIDRRLGGGAPATPDAYAKALEEWHQLPGSVVRPPTDEKRAPEPEKAGTDEADKENRS
jgi:hypothetical protein